MGLEGSQGGSYSKNSERHDLYPPRDRDFLVADTFLLQRDLFLVQKSWLIQCLNGLTHPFQKLLQRLNQYRLMRLARHKLTAVRY
jgi:hypothetical protein